MKEKGNRLRVPEGVDEISAEYYQKLVEEQTGKEVAVAGAVAGKKPVLEQRNIISIKEHDIQKHFFTVIKSYEYLFPEFQSIYAIPNGASCWKTSGSSTSSSSKNVSWSPAAMRLKEEGLRNGIPDICCPYSNVEYSSLYIEMKRMDRKLNSAQKEKIKLLHELGNKVVVCFCFDEAWRVLKMYTIERYMTRKYRNLGLAMRLKELTF